MRFHCGSGSNGNRVGRCRDADPRHNGKPLQRSAQCNRLCPCSRRRRFHREYRDVSVQSGCHRPHFDVTGDLRGDRERPCRSCCPNCGNGDAGKERSGVHAAARIRGRPGRLALADRHAPAAQGCIATLCLCARQGTSRRRGAILSATHFRQWLEDGIISGESSRACREAEAAGKFLELHHPCVDRRAGPLVGIVRYADRG